MKMKHVSSFFSLTLLLSAQQGRAVSLPATMPTLSNPQSPTAVAAYIAAIKNSATAATNGPAKHRNAQDDSDACYIDISNDHSKLAQIAAQISALDTDKNSPICQLNKHIAEGNTIALKDAVLETLAYAEEMVAKKSHTLSQNQLDSINEALNTLAYEIESGDLTVDVNDLSRSSDPIIKIREKLYVLDRAKFFDEVTFKDDVTINGSLSSADAIIGCDLTVGCNISMNDSVSADIGNIIKDGASFIHTYPADSDNVFVGGYAGNFTMTGEGNSGFGAYALEDNTAGMENTACGLAALADNTVGVSNTAMGYVSLVNNTIGNANTAQGWYSLLENTTGNANTACGLTALASNTIGSGNAAFGIGALSGNITGNGNIALGAGAGTSHVSGNDTIYIGNAGGNETGVIRIGTNAVQTSCFIQGISGVTVPSSVAVYIDAAGQLGTIVSSNRFKHDVAAMAADSEIIYQLNPVTFAFNGDASETKQYGLIAEQVDQVFPAIVIKDEDGNPYTVQYQVLPVLMLNEMIKLEARVTALENNA